MGEYALSMGKLLDFHFEYQQIVSEDKRCNVIPYSDVYYSKYRTWRNVYIYKILATSHLLQSTGCLKILMQK